MGQEGDRKRVLEFLGDNYLMSLVQGCMDKDSLSEQEHVIVRRFLMCSLLYWHAQRLETYLLCSFTGPLPGCPEQQW